MPETPAWYFAEDLVMLLRLLMCWMSFCHFSSINGMHAIIEALCSDVFNKVHVMSLMKYFSTTCGNRNFPCYFHLLCCCFRTISDYNREHTWSQQMLFDAAEAIISKKLRPKTVISDNNIN